MAFFKFRKGGDQAPQTSNAVESVDVLRKRARHRLMGSAILVLAGVVGFPLLFDSQPRPIAVDVPIQIPDKDAKVAAASAPASVPVLSSAPTAAAVAAAAPSAGAGAAAPVATSPAPVASLKDAAGKEEVISPVKTDKVDKTEKAAEKKADSHADAKHDDKAGKKTDADTGRYVVQVGAYTDAAKLREVRTKLEKAGYKTYAQVVGGSDAKRTRVRIGPFPNKAAAQKVADKIKKMNLPAAILAL